MGFFAHHSHADTPHKEKKKCKKQSYILPHRRVTMQRKKRKEEGRRKEPTVQSDWPPRPSIVCRRPWVCETHNVCVCVCVFFPFGDLGKDLAHDQTPCGRPTSQQVDDRPPRPTTGSRRPWVWFFFFFSSGGLIFFLFLGF